jgi:hypothetical protein
VGVHVSRLCVQWQAYVRGHARGCTRGKIGGRGRVGVGVRAGVPPRHSRACEAGREKLQHDQPGNQQVQNI